MPDQAAPRLEQRQPGLKVLPDAFRIVGAVDENRFHGLGPWPVTSRRGRVSPDKADVYIRPQTERRPPEKIIALNSWIKDYASRNEFVYLDYYSSMLDERGVLKKELTFDGLHRNDAGYELIGSLAEKAVAAAFAR